MSEFEEFKRLAESRGASVRDCGAGHWQVRGKLLVNYYPKTGTIYVAGTSRSVIRGGVDAAVSLAFSPPPRGRLEPRFTKRQRIAERRRLLAADPHCHWCRCALVFETATVDHVIPLGRGGTNRRDNLVLACQSCNARRADQMPEVSDGRHA